MTDRRLYGLMAEFESADDVLRAVRGARKAGYRKMDAFTPYPVEGLARELGITSTRIPFVVLAAATAGGGVGFFMQYWSMAVDYPLNSGGRPLNSWPVFVPVAFEILILIASLAAVLSMLFLNGLPRPHHPVFYAPRFARASQDRFFLCIEATDPLFERVRTGELLSGERPLGEIIEVPLDAWPKAPSIAEPVKAAAK